VKSKFEMSSIIIEASFKDVQLNCSKEYFRHKSAFMLKMNKLYYSQQYFGHLPFIELFALILLRDNDLLFLEKYFGY